MLGYNPLGYNVLALVSSSYQLLDNDDLLGCNANSFNLLGTTRLVEGYPYGY